MSSLVHKRRQQQVSGQSEKTKMDNGLQQGGIKQQQSLPPPPKKGLTRRSVSFEKFLVTAFHIRLACTKCWRESLKFCLEMLILRSRILADHSIAAFNSMLGNLVQLSHDWNSFVLEIANVIIPKWQIRARDIVDTTILQRQWRRQQEKAACKEKEQQTEAPTSRNKKSKDIDELIEEVDEDATEDTDNKVSEVDDLENIESSCDSSNGGDRNTRQRLRLAVAGCIVFLYLQLLWGLVLLYQAGLPLGLMFLVSCLGYIAYLLQSICDFSRLNMTACSYGKSSNITMQRMVLNSVVSPDGSSNKAETDRVVKVIKLSFIEKTMSKVKLL